jgi:hypothetical protein
LRTGRFCMRSEATATSGGFRVEGAERMRGAGNGRTSGISSSVVGREAPSSLMLDRRASRERPFPLWGNLTPRLDLAIIWNVAAGRRKEAGRVEPKL